MSYLFLKNNKYSKWYINLIESRKIRNLPEDEYSEIHHILPRSLGGDNSPENLIKLKAKEHFIAHLLLCKATENNPKMVKAIHKMAFSKNKSQKRSYKIHSRIYAYIRKENAKIVSAYSKNTVTCYDNILKIFLRVPKKDFDENPARYSGPNKNIVRNKNAVKKQEETKFPYIVKIHDKTYKSITELQKDYHFMNTRLIRSFYNKSFRIRRLTKPTFRKYNLLLKDSCISEADELTNFLYNAISIKIKNNAKKEYLFDKSINITKEGSKKSSKSRTKIIYYTPKGTFDSSKEFYDVYSGIFTIDKIRSILKNPNNVIDKRTLKNYKGFLSSNDLGKTWQELGFDIKLKNNITASADLE